jgi:hypothetical protein
MQIAHGYFATYSALRHKHPKFTNSWLIEVAALMLWALGIGGMAVAIVFFSANHMCPSTYAWTEKEGNCFYYSDKVYCKSNF